MELIKFSLCLLMSSTGSEVMYAFVVILTFLTCTLVLTNQKLISPSTSQMILVCFNPNLIPLIFHFMVYFFSTCYFCLKSPKKKKSPKNFSFFQAHVILSLVFLFVWVWADGGIHVSSIYHVLESLPFICALHAPTT